MADTTASARTLFRSPVVVITDWHCGAVDSPAGGEASDGYVVCVTRRGAYVRQTGAARGGSREQVFADAGTAVFYEPGLRYRVTHPVPGGDCCTVFEVPTQRFPSSHSSLDAHAMLLHAAALGAGWRVGTKGALTVALAAASASDGWYAQLYVLPSLAIGPLAASTTIEVYEPLDDRGARQFYFNPLTIVAPVARGVAVGGTGLFFSQEGTAPGFGAGPALQVHIPHGTVTLDLIAGRRPMHDEMRLSFFAAF